LTSNNNDVERIEFNMPIAAEYEYIPEPNPILKTYDSIMSLTFILSGFWNR